MARSGKRRAVVTIESLADVNTKGSLAKQYTSVATRWTSFEYLSGDESTVPDHLKQAGANIRLNMRFVAGIAITPRYRITKGSRVFHILWIEDVAERHVDHNIYVKEIQA